jgi:hypothetical protein
MLELKDFIGSRVAHQTHDSCELLAGEVLPHFIALLVHCGFERAKNLLQILLF